MSCHRILHPHQLHTADIGSLTRLATAQQLTYTSFHQTSPNIPSFRLSTNLTRTRTPQTTTDPDRLVKTPITMGNDVAPSPAYFPTHADSPLHPPTALYQKLRGLSEDKLTKTQDFLIPPRSGKAWKVAKGAIWRLSTPAGPQVSAVLHCGQNQNQKKKKKKPTHSCGSKHAAPVVMLIRHNRSET
jgi:hypothetical protein